ncbi:MAG TPA: ribbon-helix-helix protein, CopG family [Acetobacteraceae bacterium]|nr:ribbon-helix-helix protein, CopG family [Acetobacteraceae bacterium]
MAATERVVVLMSPAEKATLDAKAARAGPVSAGELIRRAIEAYDETAETEAGELRALLSVLAATHDETMRRLARTERKLDETLEFLSRTRQ